MNNTPQRVDTITVEVPVTELPSCFEGVFTGGYPFDDHDAQQWKLRAAPIETPRGTEYVLLEQQDELAYTKALGVVQEGYQVPVNHENEGGGPLTIPYTLVRNDDGKVVDIELIFVREPRKRIISDPDSPTNLGVTGGFQDPGETSEEAARREHFEETDGINAGKIHEVSERRSVANRAFDLVVDELEGTKVYAYEMTPAKRQELEAKENNIILSWKEAKQSRDMLVKGAILDLLMWIVDNYDTAL